MRRNLAVLALVGAFMTATPAAAATGPTAPEPWQPYAATDFVAPAGKYCAFDLAVAAVTDEEEYRVVSRYPDGTTRLLEFRGALVSRFTNTATGASVQRDLSGHAWEELYPDGATPKSFTGLGPFSFGFRAEDDFARGYYRLDGVTVLTLAQDGTRRLVVTGSAENLCETLT